MENKSNSEIVRHAFIVLVVAAFLIMVEYTIAPYIEHYTEIIRKEVWLIGGLIFVPIVTTWFIVYFAARVNIHSIVKELKIKADAAAHNFEICNINSPLAKLLLDTDDICRIEKQTSDEVFIITRDLKFDENEDVKKVVADNLRRGVRYYYLLKKEAHSSTEIPTFKTKLMIAIDTLNKTERTPKHKGTGQSAQEIVDHNTHFSQVPETEFNFLTDIVVYNPGKEDGTCQGYVKLSEKDLPRGIRALLITNSDSLKDLVRSIRKMKDYKGNLCIPEDDVPTW